MKEFLLALFTFPEELDIINNQCINRPELILKSRDISFFNSPDKFVNEVFTT